MCRLVLFDSMELKQLTQTLRDSVEAGVNNAISATGELPDLLSKAQAYSLYGRSNVDRWIDEGLINASHSKGNSSKQFIDRIKLEQVAASSNRITYLPVTER